MTTTTPAPGVTGVPTLRSTLPGGAPPAVDVIESVNPADTSDVVARVELAGPQALVDAARTANAAQRRWAAVPPPVRGRVIAAIGRLVEANAEALSALITREVGKPLAESRGEVQEVVDTCDFFLGEGRRLYGQTVPSEMPDKQLFTFRVPVGTAVVITAGNFPMAVPSWYLVPALLAGNAVVWKPAEYAAACADAMARVFVAGGLPDGLLTVVHADGAATSEGLNLALEAGLVGKVGFTGSTDVGRRIGALCGKHLQTPCLELGGKNPMVVTADADLDLAVEGALFSGFGTAGQRCTSLGTVIVHEQVHDEFVARFDAAVRAAAVGDPTRDVVMGPLLAQRFADRYEEFLGWVRPHHTVLGSTGVGRVGADNPRDGFVGDPDAGIYYHPVILDGVRPDDEVFRNETFGPLVGVTTYSTLDEAIELANAPGYGLSSSIYTTNPTAAFRFRQGIGAVGFVV
jgi:aldehyde dehydrogenase (NAD+)